MVWSNINRLGQETQQGLPIQILVGLSVKHSFPGVAEVPFLKRRSYDLLSDKAGQRISLWPGAKQKSRGRLGFLWPTLRIRISSYMSCHREGVLNQQPWAKAKKAHNITPLNLLWFLNHQASFHLPVSLTVTYCGSSSSILWSTWGKDQIWLLSADFLGLRSVPTP
jgi:hypothetical protein